MSSEQRLWQIQEIKWRRGRAERLRYTPNGNAVAKMAIGLLIAKYVVTMCRKSPCVADDVKSMLPKL